MEKNTLQSFLLNIKAKTQYKTSVHFESPKCTQLLLKLQLHLSSPDRSVICGLLYRKQHFLNQNTVVV